MTQTGAETTLDVSRFRYSGRTRVIRADVRKAAASGLTVRELGDVDLKGETRQQLKHITGQMHGAGLSPPYSVPEQDLHFASLVIGQSVVVAS